MIFFSQFAQFRPIFDEKLEFPSLVPIPDKQRAWVQKYVTSHTGKKAGVEPCLNQSTRLTKNQKNWFKQVQGSAPALPLLAAFSYVTLVFLSPCPKMEDSNVSFSSGFGRSLSK